MSLKDAIRRADSERPSQILQKELELQEQLRSAAGQALESQKAAELAKYRSTQNFIQYLLPIFQEIGAAKGVSVSMDSRYRHDEQCFYTSKSAGYSTSGNSWYQSHVTGDLSWGYEYSEIKPQRSLFKRSITTRLVESYHHIQMRIDDKGVVTSEFFNGFAPNEESRHKMWQSVENIMVNRDGELHVNNNSYDPPDPGAP